MQLCASGQLLERARLAAEVLQVECLIPEHDYGVLSTNRQFIGIAVVVLLVAAKAHPTNTVSLLAEVFIGEFLVRELAHFHQADEMQTLEVQQVER